MIRCIVIDDEPFGRDLILDHLKRFKDFQVIQSFTNSVESRDWLLKNDVDLIFTDIEMPGLKGFDILNSIDQNPLIVFITAFKQYALESYNYKVIDYLVKPIDTERFEMTINKIREYRFKDNTTDAKKKYFFINCEYQLVKINYQDITYIEGLKDYVKIYLKDQVKPLLTRNNLKGIEELLDPALFSRVHKSFIIGIENIKKIKRGSIELSNIEIPLSDIYKDDLFKKLQINKGSIY